MGRMLLDDSFNKINWIMVECFFLPTHLALIHSFLFEYYIPI